MKHLIQRINAQVGLKAKKNKIIRKHNIKSLELYVQLIEMTRKSQGVN